MSCYGWAWVVDDGCGLGMGTYSKELLVTSGSTSYLCWNKSGCNIVYLLSMRDIKSKGTNHCSRLNR